MNQENLSVYECLLKPVFNLKASSKWKEVSSHVKLFGNHNAFLKEVASVYHAFF